MSYRIRVNGVQIFGNNESYPEWEEFIRSQGIEIGEEGNYEGETTDFMGMLQTVENIVLHMEEERRERAKAAKEAVKRLPENEQESALSAMYGISSIFNFTNIPKKVSQQNKDDRFRTSLFDMLEEYIRSGYAFMPYALYLACKDKLEPDKIFAVDGHFLCYKVKAGETIRISAG